MTEPKLRRINRGSGHSYTIDGEWAPGVTTIGGIISKPAFIDSAAKKTAAYAIDHWAELLDMTPSERYQVLLKARFLTLNAAAAKGTRVHALAERYSRGEEVEIPEDLRGYVESCVRYFEEWRAEPILTEAPVFNLTWGYAGTLDAVHRLPDGRVIIVDYKTGGTGVWWDTAYQLAAYRHAEVYLKDGETHPIADLGITEGQGIWLRSDGYDPYPIRCDDHVFKKWLHTIPLWWVNEYEGSTWKGDALAAPKWDDES